MVSRVRVALLVIPGLCLAAAAHPLVGEDETAITAKMSSLAGDGARVCGLIKRGGRLDEAWKCAESMELNHTAYWLAVEWQGVDSRIWTIIARQDLGRHYFVSYDSNPKGQPAFAPSFAVTQCEEPYELKKDNLKLPCRGEEL